MGLLHIHLDGGLLLADERSLEPSLLLHLRWTYTVQRCSSPTGLPCLPSTRPDTKCTGDAIHPIAPSTAPSHFHRAVAPRCARSVRPSPASREGDHHGNTLCTRVESGTDAPR